MRTGQIQHQQHDNGTTMAGKQLKMLEAVQLSTATMPHSLSELFCMDANH